MITVALTAAVMTSTTVTNNKTNSHLPIQVRHFRPILLLFYHHVDDKDVDNSAKLDEQGKETDGPFDQYSSCPYHMGPRQHDLQEGRHRGDTSQESDGIEWGHLGQHAKHESHQPNRVQRLDGQHLPTIKRTT